MGMYLEIFYLFLTLHFCWYFISDISERYLQSPFHWYLPKRPELFEGSVNIPTRWDSSALWFTCSTVMKSVFFWIPEFRSKVSSNGHHIHQISFLYVVSFKKIIQFTLTASRITLEKKCIIFLVKIEEHIIGVKYIHPWPERYYYRSLLWPIVINWVCLLN